MPDALESRRKRGRRDVLWTVPFGILCLVALIPGPARAEETSGGKVAEEVVAVVGDNPILRSEVEEQAQAIAEQMQMAPSDTAAYRKLHSDVLQRLVDDQLILLEAKAQDLKVDEAEVEKAVEDALQGTIRQLGGEEAFRAQLRKEGLTELELRQRYHDDARKQLLAQRLIQKDIRPKVTLTDEDARRFFNENRSQLPKKPRAFHVRDLFVRTRPDSVLVERTRQQALEVRKKILAGLDFSEAAARYSDDPRAKETPYMGRVSRGDLDPDLEPAAFALSVGEVSQPILSRFGYHLLKAVDKDPGGEWVELDHILFSIVPSKLDEEATRERAEALLRRLQRGEIDFIDAIHQYSEDPVTRARDGDMDWIPFDNFYGEMKAVAETLRVGRIGGPAAGEGGFHIFKIEGEQAEGNYTFDEVKDEMAQLAGQQAMEKELRTWLDGVRQKYFVEVHSPW